MHTLCRFYPTSTSPNPVPTAAEVFGLPTPFEEVRAPTEAFFKAWFEATNTTSLPDFSTYNRSELHHARLAVLGLLAPKVINFWRAATGLSGAHAACRHLPPARRVGLELNC